MTFSRQEYWSGVPLPSLRDTTYYIVIIIFFICIFILYPLLENFEFKTLHYLSFYLQGLAGSKILIFVVNNNYYLLWIFVFNNNCIIFNVIKASLLVLSVLCAKFLPSYPTLTPWTSLPGYSAHGSLQARTLEWIAISSSRGSSQTRAQTSVSGISCIARWVPYH